MKSDSTEETLRRYVGPWRIHDATVLRLEPEGDSLTVHLRSIEDDPFALVFSGVSEVRSLRPEGMILYALAEFRTGRPRRFAFLNTDEEAEEYLEVRAAGLRERKDPLPRLVRRLARPFLELLARRARRP